MHTSSACFGWTMTKACSGEGTAPALGKGMIWAASPAQQTAACGVYNPLLKSPPPSHTALQPGLPRCTGGLPAVAAHPAADSHICQHHVRPSAAGGAAGGGAGGGRSVGRGDWAAFFGWLFFQWNLVRQFEALAAERRMRTRPLCSALSMLADFMSLILQLAASTAKHAAAALEESRQRAAREQRMARLKVRFVCKLLRCMCGHAHNGCIYCFACFAGRFYWSGNR